MSALDPERLLAARVETRQTYAQRDCILYALSLGIGAGDEATDPEALRYLLERDLIPLPSFATMLAYPGAWYADPVFGIDAARMVNGGQSLELHAALPPAGTVTSVLEVEALTDKGAGHGALIHTRRTLRLDDAQTDLATIRQTYFCRGAGGFNGPIEGPRPPGGEIPTRPADLRLELATRRDAALLFRLSGDWNLLHADPAAARAAGFERPILQGLATFGVASHRVYAHLQQPGRMIASVEVRYSAPVLPGDALACDIWLSDDAAAFRVVNRATDKVALDQGRMILGPKAAPSQTGA